MDPGAGASSGCAAPAAKGGPGSAAGLLQQRGDGPQGGAGSPEAKGQISISLCPGKAAAVPCPRASLHARAGRSALPVTTRGPSPAATPCPGELPSPCAWKGLSDRKRLLKLKGNSCK